MNGNEPGIEYEKRIALRRASLRVLERRDAWISHARLVVFLLALALLVVGLAAGLWSAWWALLPLGLYLVLVVVHDRVIGLAEMAKGSVAFYERGLERLRGTWHGKGVTRTDLAPREHPYAADLDLFGEGSLFDLMCTARTLEGEETLARWLLSPSSPGEIASRHEAVDELVARLDLREDLALVGGSARAGVHPDSLARWADGEDIFGKWHRLLTWLCVALALCAVAAVVAWAALDTGPIPLLVVALLEWITGRLIGKRTGRVVLAITHPHQQLTLLAGVLARIEKEPVASQMLARIKDELGSGTGRASASIRHLARLVGWLDAPRNVLFAVVAHFLMWRQLFALFIERWRVTSGRRIGAWLDAVGEFEALCSIASFRYENPSDVWPVIVDKGAVFEAGRLGHPLVGADMCVHNDIHLGEPVRAMIVSGSNMSGKSTLLRTVGVSVVMALAGAPVRAESMRLSPLAVGATIRIHDSLHGKTSRFYAEIKRLRQLADMAQEGLPLLFLLDEVFHGTNSHDRLVGATALLSDFLQKGSLGLVVTHDLAIAEAAGEFGDRVENVHFVDRLVDGRLVFDYKLYQGVVQRSNALDLMREVGLKV